MKKVIIVEEDLNMVQIISWILERSECGLIKSTAKTVWQDTLCYQPELIILNDRYSYGEWHSFIHKLKLCERTMNIPLMIYSIFHNNKEIASYNADVYLEKPFELETFTATVEKILKGHSDYLNKSMP